jgi:acyl carrier protein
MRDKRVRAIYTTRGVGLDALDIIFRLEKSFEIVIPRGRVFEEPSVTRYQPTGGFPVMVRGRTDANESPDVDEPPPKQARANWYDITAGEIHDRVCELVREQGKAVPFSCWHRVKKCLSDALGVSPKQIRRESWLSEDLGAF